MKRDGFDPWLDEEKLLPGQDWEHEIKRAVRKADLVVVCLSPRSISRDGYVHKEIKLALDVADEKPDGTVYLVPAKLEECEVPDRLRRWQWVNLFEDGGYEKMLRTFQQRAEMLGAAIPPDVPSHFFYAPSASSILVTPDGREVYTVEEESGSLTVIENMPHAGSGLKTKASIDLNRSGTAAHPQRLALNPDTNIIYVTDPLSDEIIVVDRGHNNELVGRISVGRLPRSIVFTSGGDKAYVSNEGPIPQGTISVIDAHHHRVIRTIRGVTRCSWSIRCVGMAVGVSVAVSPKHRKLYVARGDFRYRDPQTGESGSPLSVIYVPSRREVRTHTLQTAVNHAILAPDEDCVLAGNGDQVTIVETGTDAVVRSFRFGTPPLGIAVSQEKAIYVHLRESQIKLFGLSD